MTCRRLPSRLARLREHVLPACLAGLLFAAHARGDAPAPLDPARFAFPGSLASPPTGASAGSALADRWLGTSPFENPAADVPQGITASPLLERVNRQDVSAANRDFSQKGGYLDFASGSLAFPWHKWSLTLYAWQPAVRLEGQSFTIGRNSGTGASGSLVTEASLRELRAGVAIGRAFGAWRAGAAGEWIRRQDSYQTQETSGSPDAGLRTVAFDGDGFGGSAGLTWERDADARWGTRLGAALHMTSQIAATGAGRWTLASGDSAFSVTPTRHGVWEGGLSARVTVAPGTHALASIGGRGGETWDNFDVHTDLRTEWHAGLEWRDPEAPYAVRLGLGQENEPGAAESRAGSAGAGFSWYSGETTIDVGIMHRAIVRAGAPNSYDDRAVASVRVRF